MLYEIFVLSQLWSHMMDDLWIIKNIYIWEHPNKSLLQTPDGQIRGGKKTWRGGKGSGKYWGLQFVHSFSSIQASIWYGVWTTS